MRELEGASLLRWQQLQLEEADRSVRRLVRGLDCFSGGGAPLPGAQRCIQGGCKSRLLLPSVAAPRAWPPLPFAVPFPARPAEGILLLDAEDGWAVRYTNSALQRLTGLQPQQVAGAAFWQLFAPAPGSGATRDGVQQAARGQQPFTVPCVLLHATNWSNAADLGGSLSSASASLSGAGSGDVGGAGLPAILVAAAASGAVTAAEARGWQGGEDERAAIAVFSVTFTPASGPDFRPDEQPIAIPPHAGNAASSSMSSSLGTSGWAGGPSEPADGRPGVDPTDRFWFATVQRLPAPAPAPAPALSGSSAAQWSVTAASLPSSPPTSPTGAAAVSRHAYLRPANMQNVTLGPLLGVGATGRCGLGLGMLSRFHALRYDAAKVQAAPSPAGMPSSTGRTSLMPPLPAAACWAGHTGAHGMARPSASR